MVSEKLDLGRRRGATIAFFAAIGKLMTCHHNKCYPDVMVMQTQNKENRRRQLRLAKREQRSRQRQDGLVPCQIVVPKALATSLREVAKRPDLTEQLRRWLALEAIEVAAWPQLSLLCWGRHDQWIAGADALATYERNWRFVTREALTAAEENLIRGLVERHGKGVFNG